MNTRDTSNTSKLLEEIEENNQKARAHLAEFEKTQLEKALAEQSRLKGWAEFVKKNLKAITGGKL